MDIPIFESKKLYSSGSKDLQYLKRSRNTYPTKYFVDSSTCFASPYTE